MKNGATLARAIGWPNTQERDAIPIILFSYYNPVFAYGLVAFYRDLSARRTGCSSWIFPTKNRAIDRRLEGRGRGLP